MQISYSFKPPGVLFIYFFALAHRVLRSNVLWLCRFSGGFGARDYRQMAGGGNSFGNRGARNPGGNRGFGGNKGMHDT